MRRRTIRVPRTLRLAGVAWRVRFTDRDLFIGKDKCVALTALAERVIWIDSRQPLEEQRRCLAHEVVHAALADFYGASHKIEERVALLMEQPMIAFARSLRGDLG